MAKGKKPSVKVKDMNSKKNPAGGAIPIKSQAATIKWGDAATVKSPALKIDSLNVKLNK